MMNPDSPSPYITFSAQNDCLKLLPQSNWKPVANMNLKRKYNDTECTIIMQQKKATYRTRNVAKKKKHERIHVKEKYDNDNN